MSNTTGLFLPLSFFQGDDLDLLFTLEKDGLLVDPSTVTLEGSFRLNADDPDPQVFTFEVDEEDSYLNKVVFTSEDSELLSIGTYNYQIRIDDGTKKKTILFGTLQVKDSPL